MSGDYPTETARRICVGLVPEWEKLFLQRNADYGEAAADLGLKGQYADIHRKLTKLRRALWDGKKLNGEQPDEIVLDLIGHLFLTLDMLRNGGSE